MQLLAITLICWLVVVVVEASAADPSPGWSSWFKRHRVGDAPTVEMGSNREKEVDFDGLNEYLLDRRTIANNDNLQENLAIIRANIDELTGGVKVAAEMLLELHDFGGHQCNNKVLSTLLDLHKIKPSLNRHHKIDRLLKAGWATALTLCASHIQQSYKESSPKMASFFRQFSPYADKMHYLNTSHQMLTDKQLYMKLIELANGSPETQFETMAFNKLKKRSFIIKQRAKYDYAFEELLVKPCRFIVSNEELMETAPALALANIQSRPNMNLFARIDALLTDMIWVRQTCKTILDMDTSQRTRIYNS